MLSIILYRGQKGRSVHFSELLWRKKLKDVLMTKRFYKEGGYSVLMATSGKSI